MGEQKVGSTRGISDLAGLMALICGGTSVAPFLILMLVHLGGWGRGRMQLEQRLSDFIFDYGFFFDVLALLFAGCAFARGGRSRRYGFVALGLIAASFALLFLDL